MYELLVPGPPKFQPFDPFHYVIVGHSFVLNCTATNDPQSPKGLTFKWYMDQNKNSIDNNNQWNITEHVINNITVTSQLVITDLNMTQHNGTYVCEVRNSNNRRSLQRQKTIVVVEGINLLICIVYSFSYQVHKISLHVGKYCSHSLQRHHTVQ